MSDLDQTLTEAATLLSRSGVFDRSDLIEVPAGYYELGEPIARGGMGRISTARDLRSGRIVAIKEVLAEVFEVYPAAEREEVLGRFCREAIITARLEHPSIVPVYEIGRFGDAPFFAMKRVTGEPLHDRMKAADSFEERLALLPKIAAVTEAMAYAHDRGVIHRDLKPGNVLVGEFGETLVIDWGLAKDIGVVEETRQSETLAESSIDETLEGSVIGTPQYMPPEQARGEPVDRRADVYSIGAMLYHLLAGAPPYPVRRQKGVNPIVDVLRRVRDEKPEPLGDLAPQIPADLLSIVDKAMARDPGDRYADAGELAADLASFQRGQLVAVHDYSAAELLRRWVRRHRGAIITAAILVAALIGSGVWFVVQNRQARQTAEAEKRIAEAAVDRWVSMFEQRGRAELHRGDIATAALVLSETYRQMPDDPGVATMLADALRAIEPLEAVYRVTESPLFGLALDGDRLVSVSQNGQLLVSDPDSGKRLHSSAIDDVSLLLKLNDERNALLGPDRITIIGRAGERLRTIETTGKLISVASDHRGRRIAVGTQTGFLEVFDVETGERLGSQRLSIEGVNASVMVFAVAIHADGSVLVSWTGHFGIYNDPTLSDQLVKLVAEKPIITIDVSPTLDRAALGTTDGRALLIDSRSGNSLRVLDGHRGEVSVNFDPTGTRVITWDQTSTRVWDAESGKLLTALGSWSERTTSLALSPDGALLAIGGHSGNIALIDLRQGRMRQRLIGHASQVYALDFDRDGRRLVSTGAGGIVKRWDARADLLGSQMSMGGVATILRRGDRLVTYHDDQPVRLWDLEQRRPIATLAASGTAAMSRDGSLVVTRQGTFSSADGEPLHRFDLEGTYYGIAVGPGVVATTTPEYKVEIRGLDGSLRRVVDTSPSRLVTIQLINRGKTAIASAMGSVLLVDVATGAIRTIEHQPERRSLVIVDPFEDDRRVLLRTTRQLAIWDTETNTRIATREPGAASVAVHPDGDIIAMSRDDYIELWYPATDRAVTLGIPGHRKGTRLRFSDDGTLLVTTGDTVRIWEIETREILLEREVGRPLASDSFVVAGNRTLITVSPRSLSFWPLPSESRRPETIRRLVSETVPRDFTSGRGVVSRPVPAVRLDR